MPIDGNNIGRIYKNVCTIEQLHTPRLYALVQLKITTEARASEREREKQKSTKIEEENANRIKASSNNEQTVDYHSSIYECGFVEGGEYCSFFRSFLDTNHLV